MTQFTEAKLEQAIIELLGAQGYPHYRGDTLARGPSEALLKDDLRAFLSACYASDGITAGEIEAIVRRLEAYPAADLYESNKAIHKLVADGFLLKREDSTQKDLHIQLVDYAGLPEQRPPLAGEVETLIAENHAGYADDRNIFKLVNQLVIEGTDKRIPDAILYINGLPLVVFEFKSAVREEVRIEEAYKQLTNRYTRAIPELMKFNALCVISDGVNSRMGSLSPSVRLLVVSLDRVS